MKLGLGLGAVVVGLIVAVAAAGFVHAAESEIVNELGNEMYTWAPRGWVWVLLGQVVSIGGVLLAMAGLTLAFVFDRPMTWARASIGAALFVGLMLIIFGLIPNQFLTLTQSTLEWTPQKTFVAVPQWLALNNELSVSYAALKDILLQGFVATMLIGIPVFMWWWQGYQKRRDEPKPQPVSSYGRPMRVED